MDVRTIRSLDQHALSYLLADLASGEAALIDPQARDMPLIQAMLSERQLRLRWVLRTHDHDEQRSGELAALRRLGAPIVQGRPEVDVEVPADGDTLPLGASAIRVFRTPGHTAHCLSYVWADRVFCGDLLNVGDCPWQRWPADAAALWDSVSQRVFTLPDETLLFPGQDCHSHSVSTVHDQRRWHPYFAQCSRDDYLARIAALEDEAQCQQACP
jgi:glyoxylase-like metal-dependent hydrolase (beta-lactamase superfamily II)